MPGHVFARLDPESAELWRVEAARLLEACDPTTGFTETQHELSFRVLGFSGLREYTIEPRSEVHFGDTEFSIRTGRGPKERSIDECSLFGEKHILGIRAVEGFFKVTRSAP